MKYHQLLVIGLSLAAKFSASAQRTIINPREGFKLGNSNVKITKVELRDSVTVLYFMTKARAGTWIRVPGNTYIQPAGDTVKYWVRGTEGIPFDKEYYMPDSGVARYAVYFPAIKKNTAVIDYGEDASGGWKIYDVELTRRAGSVIPEYLDGEWYDRNSGALGYVFCDSVVLSGGVIVDYTNFRKKVAVSRLSDSVIRITSDGRTLVYCNNRKACTMRHDEAVFTAPVLKKGMAVLGGYVRNYNTRHFPKNMMVYVNDILTGNQENVLLEIAPDGRFSKEIPLNYPEEVFAVYGNSRQTLFLEPGKQLFVIVGSDETQFMGSLAGINDDLHKMEGIHVFDYNRVSNGPVMAPDSFRTYVFDCSKREMRIIDSLYERKEIGKRARQVRKIETLYNYLGVAMEYRYIYHDAPPYPAGYLSYITPGIANDPLAYLTSSYYFFINRIKFAEQLRETFMVNLNIGEIIGALKKSGAALSENDERMIARMTPDGMAIRPDSVVGGGVDSVLGQFNSAHAALIQKLIQQRSEEIYYRKYDSALSLSTGSQAIDIMRAQDILAPIVEKLAVATDSSLKAATASIREPFIRKYIFE